MPDVEIPEVSVTDYVFRMVDTYPDRPALIDGPTGRTYTFTEFRDMVRRFAGGLAGSSLRPQLIAIAAEGCKVELGNPHRPESAVAGAITKILGAVGSADDDALPLHLGHRTVIRHPRPVALA